MRRLPASAGFEEGGQQFLQGRDRLPFMGLVERHVAGRGEDDRQSPYEPGPHSLGGPRRWPTHGLACFWHASRRLRSRPQS